MQRNSTNWLGHARQRLLVAVSVLALAITSVACGGGATPVQQPDTKLPGGAPAGAGGAGAKELTGAGATFPYPLYSKWFDVYNQKTGVRINYQSVGSGGRHPAVDPEDRGLRCQRRPDDRRPDSRPRAERAPHPHDHGAVVATYNLPGIDRWV